MRLVGIGRPSLRVPSIVEDAHFACVRAVEQAAGTRSEMAVRTVGCGVCELRGFGDDDGEVEGVRRALAEAVRCSGGEGADPFDADGELCLGNFRLVGAGRKNAKEDESLGRDIGAKCKNAKDAESSGGNVGAGCKNANEVKSPGGDVGAGSKDAKEVKSLARKGVSIFNNHPHVEWWRAY